VEGDANTHLLLVRGDVRGHEVLTRVHSECLTGEVLGSLKCDCGEQLDTALQRIAVAGRGVVVYLRGHEGRGIGLVDKLRAYALQDAGLDTIEANLALGYPVDARDYRAAGTALAWLGVRGVRLMTNNADKVRPLTELGIDCVCVPMAATVNPHNGRYLSVKREGLGHRGIQRYEQCDERGA
jgi:GTP cyclohydrolase II